MPASLGWCTGGCARRCRNPWKRAAGGTRPLRLMVGQICNLPTIAPHLPDPPRLLLPQPATLAPDALNDQSQTSPGFPLTTAASRTSIRKTLRSTLHYGRDIILLSGEGQMESQLPNISGFFTIDTQTRGTRIAWILGIPVGIALLSLGVHFTMEAIHNRGGGAGPEGMEILLFVVFLFILPALLVVAGLKKMYQEPGVYFNGIRTTDSGFEAGSLTVDLDSVEPRNSWRQSCSGRILQAIWKPEKPIAAQSLRFVVFLKEDRDLARHYFFERFVIASEEAVLHQLTGAKTIAETNSNNFVSMLNGSFQLLGDRQAVRCHSLLPSLERIADVLSTSVPASPPSCTLNVVAKTVGLAMALPFGLVGGLISAGIDSRRRHKLEESLKQGRVFDADFTENLMAFLNRRGWMITAGDLGE